MNEKDNSPVSANSST